MPGPSPVGGTRFYTKDSPRASWFGSGEEKHPFHLKPPLLRIQDPPSSGTPLRVTGVGMGRQLRLEVCLETITSVLFDKHPLVTLGRPGRKGW